jgi:FkbM family methyltransferase
MGVARPLLRLLRRVRKSSYEQEYEKRMLQTITVGDTVWDIGANVGVFTRQFALAAGPLGKVVAFEPSPSTFSLLSEETASLTNVKLVNIALADYDGHGEFSESAVIGDSTNSLLPETETQSAVHLCRIPVFRGDTFCDQNPSLFPSSIKIDVEGFELEVLSGLEQSLKQAALRSLFVEVHFQILKQRNMPNAVHQIVKLLQDSGFDVQWTDASHIIASRQ